MLHALIFIEALRGSSLFVKRIKFRRIFLFPIEESKEKSISFLGFLDKFSHKLHHDDLMIELSFCDSVVDRLYFFLHDLITIKSGQS